MKISNTLGGVALLWIWIGHQFADEISYCIILLALWFFYLLWFRQELREYPVFDLPANAKVFLYKKGYIGGLVVKWLAILFLMSIIVFRVDGFNAKPLYTGNKNPYPAMLLLIMIGTMLFCWLAYSLKRIKQGYYHLVLDDLAVTKREGNRHHQLLLRDITKITQHGKNLFKLHTTDERKPMAVVLKNINTGQREVLRKEIALLQYQVDRGGYKEVFDKKNV